MLWNALKEKISATNSLFGNIDKFEDEGKVYSNDKLKSWIQAKTGSKEETQNYDNAVCQWIEKM